MSRIIEQFQLWQAYLPQVYPYYAVKCNDHAIVLEVLAAFETGFACASKNEIEKILNLGVDRSRIIYGNPNKFVSHIHYAAAMGIQVMTFDNESELHKIKNYFPNARLLIGIRCDETDSQTDSKFGCDYRCEARNLLEIARDLNLNVIGVSFHVGFSVQNPNIYRTAIIYSRAVFHHATSIGYDFNILDIGGGFPGYRGQLIHNIFHVVNDALNEFFSDLNVQIIAEPGRFFVASSYTLACIISHRSIQISNTDSMLQHNMYYIPGRMHGCFNILQRYQQNITPILLKPYSDKGLFSSSVWGSTCDGLDQVCENILLPQLTIGEWLIFENMGAYRSCPANNFFNDIPITKVLFIGDKTVWLYLKDIKYFKSRFLFLKNIRDIVEDLD
ncbi:Ornithine decarboxylase 1 [Carabus blaptoides fortunei]